MPSNEATTSTLSVSDAGQTDHSASRVFESVSDSRFSELPEEILEDIARKILVASDPGGTATSLAIFSRVSKVCRAAARSVDDRLLVAQGMHVDDILESVELMEWAKQQGFDFTSSAYRLGIRAIDKGQIESLRWLIENGCPDDVSMCNRAAVEGDLEALQHFRAAGCPWDPETCFGAMSNGHLGVLQWLIDNGCPPPGDIFKCAINLADGDLEMFDWLKAKGFPLTVSAFDEAAAYGSLETLKWLKDNGCPWAESTCERAVLAFHGDATYMNMRILVWLRTNGCPWNAHACLATASDTDFPEMAQWIQNNMVDVPVDEEDEEDDDEAEEKEEEEKWEEDEEEEQWHQEDEDESSEEEEEEEHWQQEDEEHDEHRQDEEPESEDDHEEEDEGEGIDLLLSLAAVVESQEDEGEGSAGLG